MQLYSPGQLAATFQHLFQKLATVFGVQTHLGCGLLGEFAGEIREEWTISIWSDRSRKNEVRKPRSLHVGRPRYRSHGGVAPEHDLAHISRKTAEVRRRWSRTTRYSPSRSESITRPRNDIVDFDLSASAPAR